MINKLITYLIIFKKLFVKKLNLYALIEHTESKSNSFLKNSL